MTTNPSQGVNIHDERRCLNKLDEEIERALQELDSLNAQTISHTRMIKSKAPTNKPQLATVHRSASFQQKPTLNTSLTDSLDGGQPNSALIKHSNQGHLQLSPTDLIPRGDPLREEGFDSIEDTQQDTVRDQRPGQLEESYYNHNMPRLSAWERNETTKKLKPAMMEKKHPSPSRKRLCDPTTVSYESTYGSYILSKDQTVSNQNMSKKPPHNMFEFHKMSNIDLPREIIHGNSKPEQFFGHQQQMRRQSTNATSEKSPSLGTFSSGAHGNNVVDRLMQYGKQKEERLKARMEGRETDVNKKISSAKLPPKVKLSSSFVMSRDDDREDDEDPASPKLMNGQPGGPTAKFSYEENLQGQSLLRRGSLRGDNSSTITQKGKSDPFYELYREGCEKLSDGARQLQEVDVNQNGTVYNKGSQMNQGNKSQNEESSSNGSKKGQIDTNKLLEELLRPKHQSTSGTNTPTKYQNIEARYMKGKEGTKSPQPKSPLEEIKPSFRPQLSKKSLELAAKLGDSFQRLVDQGVTKAEANKRKLVKEMEKEYTFKPQINRVSEQMDQKFRANLFNGDELHRYDQLHLMKDRYTLNKEMLKRQREREESENNQCTFQPAINPNSYRIYRDNRINFAERASAWKETKEKRLNKKREIRLDKEVEDCTFHPTISKSPTLGMSQSVMDLTDASNVTIRGLDQHFEKVDRANRLKKELEARQNKYSGKSWKNQITVPKEFHLSRRGTSATPYSRQQSSANLDVSTEEKINRNVLFLERGRDMSPQPTRHRDFMEESWLGNTYEYITPNDNFGDAVVRLHYELQNMHL